MRSVLIISPNLEHGLCGVSDYSLELKSQFSSRGFVAYNLAMCDHYISEIINEPTVLRIPFSYNKAGCLNQSFSYINQIKPNVIYFNFISYGYNRKGFPKYLFNFLNYIRLETKLVIIVHELWPGLFFQETIKNKIVGLFQKLFICILLKSLKSCDIIVNTKIAQNLLIKRGIFSRLVPVFNNIPIESNSIVNDEKYYKIILFGSSGFKIDYPVFYKLIKTISEETNKIIEINILGKKNIELFEENLVLIQEPSCRIEINTYPFLNSKDLSKLLQNCALGISYYMPQFWGKSGAIAAMLAHGLPVITISEDFFKANLGNNFLTHDRVKKAIDFGSTFYLTDLVKQPPSNNYNTHIFNSLVGE